MIMILLGWGLSALIAGIRYLLINIPGRIPLLYSPPIARAFLSEILYFPTGVAILVLVIDYLATGRVLRRHKIELMIAVLLGSLLRLANALFDLIVWLQGGLTLSRISMWASWPPSIVDSLVEGSIVVILGTLCIYIAYRVLTDRELLVKWTFLLLSAYFLWFAFDILYIQLEAGEPLLVVPLIELLSYAMLLIANAAIGIFLLGVSLRLRRGGGFEVSTPMYLRIVLLVFGIVGFLYDAGYLLSSGTMSWDLPWVLLVGIFTRIAIALMAFYPLKFAVSGTSSPREVPPTSNGFGL
ncbi:MAG: hypothetical protein ABSA11_08610 [Candidatus Bathyarchaeia archaeon]|jgi:hypothetical protein